MVGENTVNVPKANRIIPNAICVWLKKNKEDNDTMKKEGCNYKSCNPLLLWKFTKYIINYSLWQIKNFYKIY